MTSSVGLSEGQPAYTLPPTSLHLDRMVLYQHGPWIDFRARLAEIVATLQHPYSHTPPTLLSYTELHPKPAKGFLCLIAIRAARDKESNRRPFYHSSTVQCPPTPACLCLCPPPPPTVQKRELFKATPPHPNTLPLRTLPSCVPLSTPLYPGLYHRLCGLLNATSHEAALRCTIPCEDNLIHLPCHHELSEMKTQ